MKLLVSNTSDLPIYAQLREQIKDAILSVTGYTGAGGVEIYVGNDGAEKLWHAVWDAGRDLGLKNVGLGARDTLRLEMGFSLYGNDIDDSTSPLEAGLGWITKFADGKDFVGRGEMEKLKENGAERRLVGFEMVERGIPRHGYPLSDAGGNIIGRVTSGTMSPSLKKAVGMGYVGIEHAAKGSEIYVIIRDKPVKARVVGTPFK